MTRMYPLLGVLCLFSVACGGDDDEQVDIDGTWVVNSLTCDGTANPMIPGLTVTIADTTGEFVLDFAPDCRATVAENYDYPDESTISITPTSIACAPNEGCAALFGIDCIPLPPSTDFVYERSGSTLTFSKVSGGPPADNCAEGEDEVYTMTLQ